MDACISTKKKHTFCKFLILRMIKFWREKQNSIKTGNIFLSKICLSFYSVPYLLPQKVHAEAEQTLFQSIPSIFLFARSFYFTLLNHQVRQINPRCILFLSFVFARLFGFFPLILTTLIQCMPCKHTNFSIKVESVENYWGKTSHTEKRQTKFWHTLHHVLSCNASSLTYWSCWKARFSDK